MATIEALDEASVLDALVEMNGFDTRRRELGAFLRSRRERSARSRQAPAVATQTDARPQARGGRPARRGWCYLVHVARAGARHPPVRTGARRVARTLQLDSHEHAHLFTLAGVAATTIADQCFGLCSTVQPLIDQLGPLPAVVVNARLDLLAYNGAYASFFPDLESVPTEDHNILWLSFTHPEWREAIVDRDEVLGRMVAEYRGAMAEHLDDSAWKTLVARLHRASPEFATVWERHDVVGVESRTKRARHPEVGLLRLIYTNLWLGQGLGTRIVAFTPADERSRAKLESLHRSHVG